MSPSPASAMVEPEKRIFLGTRRILLWGPSGFEVNWSRKCLESSAWKMRRILLSLLGGRVPQYKYLGAIIDNKLSFQLWCEKIPQEVDRRIVFIRRLVKTGKLSRLLTERLYQGYVRGFVNYGCCVRSLASTRFLDRITCAERPGLRLCCGASFWKERLLSPVRMGLVPTRSWAFSRNVLQEIIVDIDEFILRVWTTSFVNVMHLIMFYSEICFQKRLKCFVDSKAFKRGLLNMMMPYTRIT